MGLITKPYILPPTSDSEKDYVKLEKNEMMHFRLGWHVLKNRDSDIRDTSDTERGASEEDRLGISTLCTKLSKILLDYIKSELPAPIEEIQLIKSLIYLF
jgi:hypothetical protein